MTIFLYVLYAILIIGPLYLIWAIRNINSQVKKTEWVNAQEYTTLRIDVPKNNDKPAMSAEQMFAAIHGIYSESATFQNHLSFEIVSREKYIQFYIYLPVHLKDFVEGQVYAQYPTVEIQEVGDYAREFDKNAKNFAICELELNKPDVYPIKQFTDFQVDPISAITSVMAKLGDGEEVWFQMIIKPVGDSWQEKGHSMVSSVRSGVKAPKSLFEVFKKTISKAGKMFFYQLVKPGEDFEKAPSEVKLSASVEEALKGIEQKITKLGFETKIRIMTIATDSITAKMKCQNVAAAFKQYNTTNLNGFRLGEIHVDDIPLWQDYAERSFEAGGNIFNISELASIYHLPHSSVATPSIVWSGSKKGEPPANLPLLENTAEDDLTIIGETNFRNIYRTFGIKRDDRRRHIYIVGKSGTGKSTLIENMAVNDVMAGRGVIVIDPHGELADKVLSCIPDERINDVVVFDPSDREFPVAFNLLERVDDDFKSIVASGFVGIFKKIFGDSWGPRLEHILRNTVFALLDYPDSTMLDIPRMLTNNRFRDKVIEKVKDPVIKEFWLNEFASFDSKFRTEAVSPILNKVGQFLSSSTIRNIVGQSRSSINIREIMDQKKIMVVNLSRGKIGEDNSSLLGAMMVTKVQLAAMSRADTTAENRPDSYMYVDEFQNFATDSFAVILSEARKYNLNLTMAHQYIAQLPDEVKNAVFGNAGTLITFRVGGGDADVLVKEFEPVFDTNDLVNLDKYQIYIKLLINGISSPAFSARTLAPVQKLSGNLEKVVEQSRHKYSTPRTEIQEMIMHRSRQEEEELLAEAEAFKQGGLEALLVKKPAETVHADKPKIEEKNIVAEEPETNQKPEEKQFERTEFKWINPDLNQKGSEPQVEKNTQTQSDEESEKPQKDNHLKIDNILDGKIYKERTARGGVRWFFGEEIDRDKLAKNKIIVDDEAEKMIELSKKVGHGLEKDKKEQGTDQAKKPDIDDLKKDDNDSLKHDQNLPVEQNDILPVVAEPVLPTVVADDKTATDLDENQGTAINHNNFDELPEGEAVILSRSDEE